MTSKERASSSSSSLLPTISSGLSSSIWLTALVPSISFSMGRPTNRRVKKMMNRLMSVTSTAGHQQHPVFHAGDFVIHAFQVQRQVEHAEHLHAGRMRVALRLAAGALVVNRGAHVQPAPAVGARGRR